MRFEDELRDTMRAYESDAPTVADLPDRPWAVRRSRRRVWLAAGLAAACVAAIAITVAVTRPEPHRKSAVVPARPLACPTTYRVQLKHPWVPAKPSGVNGADRLVPNATPVSAFVCAYVNGRMNPGTTRLTGSKPIRAGLSALAQTLTWLPRVVPKQSTVCDLMNSPADGDNYLLGVRYRSGTEWVSAQGEHCGGRTSNGDFESSANISGLLSTAYLTGAWKPPVDSRSTSQRACASQSLGRWGQDTAMVPGDPTAMTVCQVGIKTPPKAVDRVPANLIAALNRPTTRPNTDVCQANTPGPEYYLRFRYSSGPDVVVRVDSFCVPSLSNNSLQANDDGTALRIVQELLRGR